MALGYETLIIAQPEISDEEIEELINKLKEIIPQNGGEIFKIEKWAKRKLVYKIKGFSKGYFLLSYFSGDQVVLQELDKFLRYNERVLRYQTTKINKKIDLESLREKEPQELVEKPEEGKAPEVEEKVQPEEEIPSEKAQEPA